MKILFYIFCCEPNFYFIDFYIEVEVLPTKQMIQTYPIEIRFVNQSYIDSFQLQLFSTVDMLFLLIYILHYFSIYISTM